jgi:RNA polymerase sigma factor (sigma-70 family)
MSNTNKYLPYVDCILNATTKREQENALSNLYKTIKPTMAMVLNKEAFGKFSISQQVIILDCAMAKILCGLLKGKYDQQYAFSTWAKRIVMNCFIDETRASKMRPRIQGEAETIEISKRNDHSGEFGLESIEVTTDAVSQTEANSRMMRSQTIQLIRQAVAKVKNENQKRAFDLRFMKQLSYAEILDEMKIESMGTLKVIIARSRIAVKSELEAMGVRLSDLVYSPISDEFQVSPRPYKLRFTPTDLVELQSAA